MSDHSRFRRLEKPRAETDARQTPLASPGRFGDRPPRDAGDQEGSAGTDPRPAGHGDPNAAGPSGAGPLDRFRDPAAQPGPPYLGPLAQLESVPLAEPEPAEAQPFIRCSLCETDASRFAKRCPNCGTLLDTPDQRFFNDRLWSKRLEEKKQSDQEVSELRERGAAANLDADQQRRLGEQLAREVYEREHARLGWMDEGRGQEGRRETPGLRLLRLIPSTRLRLLVALCLFGLGCFFAYSFVRADSLPGRLPSMLFFWAVIALFVPGRSPRRRRPWWSRGD